VSIHTNQNFCKEQLKQPYCKMVNKPLLTERMKSNRLEMPRGIHTYIGVWRNRNI
jgi:hypothetical protein